MSDEKLREELRAAFSKVVDAETATQILNCIAPVCERAINEEVGAHSNEKLREELARSGRELRIEYEHRLHRSPDVADYVGAFEPIIQRAIQEAVAGAFLAAAAQVMERGNNESLLRTIFEESEQDAPKLFAEAVARDLEMSISADARAAFDEAVKREVGKEARKWATGVCSRHQTPSPECEICNWKSYAFRLRELEREKAALLAELEALIDTTRDVMKLIDDGYLIRDISKDHERDWAIRQMKAVALLAKWMKQTDELAAIIARHKPQEEPELSVTPEEACGANAGPFIARWGMSFSCVLKKGHAGEHKKGGRCFTHGPFLGERCAKCEPQPAAEGEGMPDE